MKLLLFGVLLFELVIGGCPAAFAPADLQSGSVISDDRACIGIRNKQQ